MALPRAEARLGPGEGARCCLRFPAFGFDATDAAGPFSVGAGAHPGASVHVVKCGQHQVAARCAEACAGTPSCPVIIVVGGKAKAARSQEVKRLADTVEQLRVSFCLEGEDAADVALVSAPFTLAAAAGDPAVAPTTFILVPTVEAWATPGVRLAVGAAMGFGCAHFAVCWAHGALGPWQSVDEWAECAFRGQYHPSTVYIPRKANDRPALPISSVLPSHPPAGVAPAPVAADDQLRLVSPAHLPEPFPMLDATISEVFALEPSGPVASDNDNDVGGGDDDDVPLVELVQRNQISSGDVVEVTPRPAATKSKRQKKRDRGAEGIADSNAAVQRQQPPPASEGRGASAGAVEVVATPEPTVAPLVVSLPRSSVRPRATSPTAEAPTVAADESKAAQVKPAKRTLQLSVVASVSWCEVYDWVCMNQAASTGGGSTGRRLVGWCVQCDPTGRDLLDALKSSRADDGSDADNAALGVTAGVVVSSEADMVAVARAMRDFATGLHRVHGKLNVAVPHTADQHVVRVHMRSPMGGTPACGLCSDHGPHEPSASKAAAESLAAWAQAANPVKSIAQQAQPIVISGRYSTKAMIIDWDAPGAVDGVSADAPLKHRLRATVAAAVAWDRGIAAGTDPAAPDTAITVILCGSSGDAQAVNRMLADGAVASSSRLTVFVTASSRFGSEGSGGGCGDPQMVLAGLWGTLQLSLSGSTVVSASGSRLRGAAEAFGIKVLSTARKAADAAKGFGERRTGLPKRALLSFVADAKHVPIADAQPPAVLAAEELEQMAARQQRPLSVNVGADGDAAPEISACLLFPSGAGADDRHRGSSGDARAGGVAGGPTAAGDLVVPEGVPRCDVSTWRPLEIFDRDTYATGKKSRGCVRELGIKYLQKHDERVIAARCNFYKPSSLAAGANPQFAEDVTALPPGAAVDRDRVAAQAAPLVELRVDTHSNGRVEYASCQCCSFNLLAPLPPTSKPSRKAGCRHVVALWVAVRMAVEGTGAGSRDSGTKARHGGGAVGTQQAAPEEGMLFGSGGGDAVS